MQAFAHGPFTLEPRGALRVAGKPSQRWSMCYGGDELAMRTLPAIADQSAVIKAFLPDREAFIGAVRERHGPDRIDLVDVDSGEAVGSFLSDSSCGMTVGLIDERSRYWICNSTRTYSRSVTLSEFAQIAVAHAAPPESWVCGLLPAAALATDPEDWVPPRAWDIRHVVGEGSFTRVSGAGAATLVGVTPQNFRKYTAADGASTRQNMSFAMWHLLLHKLGVKRLETVS